MPDRPLQLALLTIGGGAIAVLLGFGGAPVTIGGIAAMALGAVIAAPAARGASTPWWPLMALGVVLVGAGEGLAVVAAAAGGLLSTLGAVLAMGAALVGFPRSGAEW